MDNRQAKDRFGFTLIEILVVMAIIGMLAIVLVPLVLDAPAKARDSQRIENMHKIADFLTEQYVLGASKYNYYQFVRSDYGALNGNYDDLAILIEDNLPYFGGVFPEDPSDDNCYFGQPFCGYIYFNMEGHSYYEDIMFSIAVLVEDESNGNSDYFYPHPYYYPLTDSGRFYVIAVGK